MIDEGEIYKYLGNHVKLIDTVKSKFVCKLLLGTCGARGCSASLS